MLVRGPCPLDDRVNPVDGACSHPAANSPVMDVKPDTSFHLDGRLYLLGSVSGLVTKADRMNDLFQQDTDLDEAVAIWKP